MRTNNKMKDSEVKYKEMVGGCRGVFYKGVGKESCLA
jgi:hypothetical protein